MSKYRKLLFLILAVSLTLRVLLVFSGGQYFWPDEDRYEDTREAAGQLLAGNQRGAVTSLHSAVNPMYRVLGVIPALLEEFAGPNLKIPALLFSLFSVLNIWLLWLIVRALGGSEREALFAAFLLSLSATFFYYSRHLLPYDTAVAFALLAILVSSKNTTPTGSVLSGLLALAAFLTYSGYWLLAAFAFLAHVFLFQTPEWRGRVTRALLFMGGFLIPLTAILGMSSLLFEESLLDQYLFFVGTITQGTYSEGWVLPFAYLWAAEHILLIFWLAAVIYCVLETYSGRGSQRVVFALLGAGFIYAGLVTGSVFLQRFVVYGRLARQLVPFLCIVGAAILERLWVESSQSKTVGVALIAILALQATANFVPVFELDFPVEFQERAMAITQNLEEGKFQFLRAHFLHPDFENTSPDVPYDVRLQSPHPLEFRPYQFEGYTPEQREELQTDDISMQLIVFP